MNILSKDVKILHIFSDNCFSQNKNKYLWAFYKYLIICGILSKIIIYYPIPGHSIMEIDSDFGCIEINKNRYQNIYSPSEYERIIKNTNIKNPFQVISVNYPNSYNSNSNISQVIKVYDFKLKFSEILRNTMNYCQKIHKIEFAESDIKVALSINEECTKDLDIFNSKFELEQFKRILNDIRLAYDNVLPIYREKLLDINKIIEYISKGNNSKFYDSLYSLDKTEISKSQKLLHNLFDKFNNQNINKNQLL